MTRKKPVPVRKIESDQPPGHIRSLPVLEDNADLTSTSEMSELDTSSSSESTESSCESSSSWETLTDDENTFADSCSSYVEETRDISLLEQRRKQVARKRFNWGNFFDKVENIVPSGIEYDMKGNAFRPDGMDPATFRNIVRQQCIKHSTFDLGVRAYSVLPTEQELADLSAADRKKYIAKCEKRNAEFERQYEEERLNRRIIHGDKLNDGYWNVVPLAALKHKRNIPLHRNRKSKRKLKHRKNEDRSSSYESDTHKNRQTNEDIPIFRHGYSTDRQSESDEEIHSGPIDCLSGYAQDASDEEIHSGPMEPVDHFPECSIYDSPQQDVRHINASSVSETAIETSTTMSEVCAKTSDTNAYESSAAGGITTRSRSRATATPKACVAKETPICEPASTNKKRVTSSPKLSVSASRKTPKSVTPTTSKTPVKPSQIASVDLRKKTPSNQVSTSSTKRVEPSPIQIVNVAKKTPMTSCPTPKSSLARKGAVEVESTSERRISILKRKEMSPTEENETYVNTANTLTTYSTPITVNKQGKRGVRPGKRKNVTVEEDKTEKKVKRREKRKQKGLKTTKEENETDETEPLSSRSCTPATHVSLNSVILSSSSERSQDRQRDGWMNMEVSELACDMVGNGRDKNVAKSIAGIPLKKLYNSNGTLLENWLGYSQELHNAKKATDVDVISRQERRLFSRMKQDNNRRRRNGE